MFTPAHSLSVAPMMDWTDRHCRYFHRMIAPNALLFTEMINTGPILFGDEGIIRKHLSFDETEHPLVLQLGGSEPERLGKAAAIAATWGYDAINLNCGCPSERVLRGAFGACLMREPELVRDCVAAMVESVAGATSPTGKKVEITVKHRIGIDQDESYAFVRDFVGTVAQGGCTQFSVHARNAWLKGLSPKENREIPPLRYEVVTQLKQDFPQLTFLVNGGISSVSQAQALLQNADGVMLGRVAYHQPWVLRELNNAIFGTTLDTSLQARAQVWQDILHYAVAQRRLGIPAHAVLRHTLGLFHGLSGARYWRGVLSDPKALAAMSDTELASIPVPLGLQPQLENLD